MRQILITIGLSLIFLATGCSTEKPAQVAQEQPVGFLFPWEDAGSPTNTLELEASLLAEFYASEAEVARCFKDEGFEYERRTVTIDYRHGRGVVLTMAESLNEFGFGITDGEGNRGVVVEVRGGNLANGDYKSYVDAGGTCFDYEMRTDIQVALTEGAEPGAWLPDRLLADSEFVDAEQAWALCMQEYGYEGYTTLSDTGSAILEESMAGDVDLEKLNQKEIETARAFLDCYIQHLDPVIRWFHDKPV